MTINEVQQALENLEALRTEIESLGATIEISVVITGDNGEIKLFVKPATEWVDMALKYFEGVEGLRG